MLSVILCPRDLHVKPKAITAEAWHLNMLLVRVVMEEQ